MEVRQSTATVVLFGPILNSAYLITDDAMSTAAIRSWLRSLHCTRWIGLHRGPFVRTHAGFHCACGRIYRTRWMIP